MAFPDVAAPNAAPILTVQFDPSNPAALGYEPGGADFSAARDEARADPELERAFRGQLRRETARFGLWAQAWRSRGGGGVGWAGQADPFVPALPQALLERAKAAVERRRTWARSPAGALARRLAEAELAARSLSHVIGEARAALDRAGGLAGTSEQPGSFTG